MRLNPLLRSLHLRHCRVHLLYLLCLINDLLRNNNFLFLRLDNFLHDFLLRCTHVWIRDVVVRIMNERVQENLGLSFNEAGMLLSAVGDLRFCQVVDLERTVMMCVPKKIMKSLF